MNAILPLSYSADDLVGALARHVDDDAPPKAWLRALVSHDPAAAESAAPTGEVDALLRAAPDDAAKVTRADVEERASRATAAQGAAVVRVADVAAALVALVREQDPRQEAEHPATAAGAAAGRTRTFRVFISSTFDDFTVERDLLRRHVWPHLRAVCAQRGARFQPIDLRWGVSEEAAVDQQTMNICLGEIERCQRVTPRPDFLVLLGDRYGWRPAPPQIPAGELAAIRAWLAEHEDAVGPWPAESHVPAADDVPPHLLLDRWYERDENAVPPEHRLRRREGGYLDGSRWAQVEARLTAALRAAVHLGDLDLPDAARRRYVYSATAQEIAAGALDVADPGQAVCFVREIAGLPGGDAAFPYVDRAGGGRDEEAGAALASLRTAVTRHLGEDRVIRADRVEWADGGPVLSGAYRESLVARVREVLEASILDELAHPSAVAGKVSGAGDDGWHDELAAHRRFAEERREFFTGREDELTRIGDYLDGAGPLPLVIHGAGGTGKSALLAEAVRRAEGRPHGAVLFRFVGATPASSDGRSLLASLCRELGEVTGDTDVATPSDYADLVTELQERLTGAARTGTVWLFVDSLDQIAGTSGAARSLTWVPQTLPPGVRIVLSTRSGETLEPLRERAELLPLGGLPTVHGQALLDAWLGAARRTLRPLQRQAVLEAFERSDGNPLYLQLAFQEARRWVSGDGRPPETLAAGVRGLVEHNLLARLASEDNHGETLVATALGYLAAARHGLTEDELIDLLSRDPTLYREFLLDAYHLPEDLLDSARAYSGRPAEHDASRWLRCVREAARMLEESPWVLYRHLEPRPALGRTPEELAGLAGVPVPRALRLLGRMASDGVAVADDAGRWSAVTGLSTSDDPAVSWATAYRVANAAGRWIFLDDEPDPAEDRDAFAGEWLRRLEGWRDDLDAFLDVVVPARVPAEQVPGDGGGLRWVARPRPGPDLPVVFWSRLSFDLAPYLTERRADQNDLLAFYHRELQEVSAEVYATGERGRGLHSRLADYFEAGADPRGDRSWTAPEPGASVRGLSELPYHLTAAGRFEDVFATLTDFRFLEQKAAQVGVTTRPGGGTESRLYAGVFQLQDDYDTALGALGAGEGSAPSRPRLVVTAVDLGDGLALRCPHCNVVHPFGRECSACGTTHRLAEWVGRDLSCPRASCGRPLRVNEFVVGSARPA